MKDRIREVRHRSGESMKTFGAKIGISAPSVARLESGENNPSEQTVRAICTEYHVNRLWLETGEEPMILEAETADEMIDEKLANGSEFAKALLRVIARMPDDDLAVIERMFSALHDEINKKPGE